MEFSTPVLPPPDERDLLWGQMGDRISSFFEELDTLPVAPEVDATTIRNHLAAYTFERSSPPDSIIDDTVDMMRSWNTQNAHPAYFGLFNPSPTYMGVLADALVAAVNPQLGVWNHSPVGVEIEQHLLRYFGTRLGFSSERIAGSMTTGGSEANLTAVLLALTRAFPEIGDTGLRGLPSQPVLYASEESHGAIHKIAHATGLGRNAVRLVPVSPDLRMDVDALERQIQADIATNLSPFLVLATAGTTSAGVIDPLPEIARLAEKFGISFHVDAAWAGAICLADRLAPLLSGIELADSVTIDPHKWLSVPMAAGIFICKDHEHLNRTFRISADYMPPAASDGVDLYTQSIQWSRRFTGLKLFMSLATAGRQGYEEMIERQIRLGDELRQRLRSANWEIINPGTKLPIVCIRDATCFPDELIGSGTGAESEYYETVCAEIVSRGRVWISTTRLLGRPALRICLTSYLTTSTELELLVDELNGVREIMR